MWIAGIDEAGRGCVCGGLFIAGIIADEQSITQFGAKDSKKMSSKQRECVYNALLDAQKRGKIGFYIAQIDAWDIDKYGLSWAMRSGIEEVLSYLGTYILEQGILMQNQPLDIVIDGNTTFGASMPTFLAYKDVRLRTLIKGDELMPIISCASILAKVSKDNQMRTLDSLYPQYFLAKNKGYATLEHKKQIMEYGYCPHHRKSFKISL
ncbi:ribonuclease HII [Helicobacter sp. MIT 21-1697]|uniref:ribonuclease HII n=1 Tax=Helicobacter sp. MIT 21-1697 TaxID=2993733 RepID=UPI00224ABBD1|nr:ribonuclease HII [Helicobacter sp. MIT 21-1697]MCX2716569.1 ribonuclease HII [Helicobacter sp. MIT 21-1697]